MKYALTAVLVTGIIALAANLTWFYLANKRDQSGDPYAAIQRNLKCAIINIAIAIVFILGSLVGRLTHH